MAIKDTEPKKVAKKPKTNQTQRKAWEYSCGPIGGTLTTIRVIPAKQCTSTHWPLDVRCQGVLGHTGPHWSYNPDGCLERWKSKKDIKSKWDWATQHIPPGNKDYPDPFKQFQKLYRNFDKRTKIGTVPASPVSKKVQKEIDAYSRHVKRKKRKRR